jgi:hypothetical protein
VQTASALEVGSLVPYTHVFSTAMDDDVPKKLLALGKEAAKSGAPVRLTLFPEKMADAAKEGKNRMIYVHDKWGKNVRLSLSESGGTKTMASIVIQ